MKHSSISEFRRRFRYLRYLKVTRNESRCSREAVPFSFNRLQFQHVRRNQLRRRQIRQIVSPAGHRFHFRHTSARSLGAYFPVLLSRADLPNCESMWCACADPSTITKCERSYPVAPSFAICVRDSTIGSPSSR